MNQKLHLNQKFIVRIFKVIWFVVFIFISISTIEAQYKFESVFPGLNGNELMLKLQENYTPAVVLDYSTARDTLYAKIDNEKDSVHCIYTDFAMYLPKNSDPTTYLYNNGSGINAEHTYPVSKGTETGFAKSNMHHIFPSKVNVNNDRASYEYNEIKDNLTQKWYYKDAILNTIPTKNIDFYSEYGNQHFEPRENKKGDIARAMFYIKTIYKEQTDAADPTFFEHQKDTLCKWHFQDPVDSLEWERTWKISKYQDGKPNPFVLDCSLASRTFCNFIDDQCTKVGTEDLLIGLGLKVSVYPNPVTDILNISIDNIGVQQMDIKILNIMGEIEKVIAPTFKDSAIFEYSVPVSDIKTGVYLISIKGKANNYSFSVIRKFVKI